MSAYLVYIKVAIAALILAGAGAGGWYFGKLEGARQLASLKLSDAAAANAQLVANNHALLAEQTQREAAEAKNAQLQKSYDDLSNGFALSVRAYHAAQARAPVPAPVADTSGGSGGLPPGPGDTSSAELAGLTHAASDACLNSYRELQDIRAVMPKP